MFQDKPKQSKSIHVALMEDEYQFIIQRAKSLDKTISAYIRSLIKEDYLTSTNDTKE